MLCIMCLHCRSWSCVLRRKAQPHTPSVKLWVFWACSFTSSAMNVRCFFFSLQQFILSTVRTGVGWNADCQVGVKTQTWNEFLSGKKQRNKNKHCCQLTINTFQESCLHGFKYYVQKKERKKKVTELAMGTTFKSKRQNSVDLINMKNLVYFIFWTVL